MAALIPLALLVLFLVAPRTGGEKAGPGSKLLAVLLLGFGLFAIAIGEMWNAIWQAP